jgi:hypothetical protein
MGSTAHAFFPPVAVSLYAAEDDIAVWGRYTLTHAESSFTALRTNCDPPETAIVSPLNLVREAPPLLVGALTSCKSFNDTVEVPTAAGTVTVTVWSAIPGY